MLSSLLSSDMTLVDLLKAVELSGSDNSNVVMFWCVLVCVYVFDEENDTKSALGEV